MAIDIRNKTQDFSKHIVDAINSMAKIKQEQINIEKSKMLDQIERKRGLEDYQKKKDIDLKSREQEKQQDIKSANQEAIDWYSGGQGTIPEMPSQQPGIQTQDQMPQTTQPMSQQGIQQPGQPSVQPSREQQISQQPVVVNGIEYPNPMELYKAWNGKDKHKLYLYKKAYESFQRGDSSEGNANLMDSILGIDSKDARKEVQKQQAGERIALRNVETVSGSMRRLAETYRDAFNEGGIGSKLKQIRSGASLFVGGEAGNKYPATSALSGQRTEVITKIMPMLTQQGDKEGSVRLVSTVFDKLIKTVPADNTPPEPAKRMMRETIRNMFGFAKAMKQMELTNETVEGLDDKQLKEIGNSIEMVAQRIQLNPEEEKVMNEIINFALEPMNEISSQQDQSSKDNLPEFSSEQEAESANLPSGTRILINGREAIWE